MFRYLIVILSFFTSFNVYAIAVSSLLEAADPESHSAEVTIANNDGRDMFINFEMAKVEYINGEKVVTKVSRDNVKDWSFSITPSQMILRPGERKTLRMHNKCISNSCIDDADQTFAVDITPVPYVDGKATAVAVAFGYRVYFIDPAKEVRLDYKIKRKDKKTFEFANNSNTMLNAVLNFCDKAFRDDCIYQNRTLPGSTKTFKLPENAWNKRKIKATIINANEEVNEQVNF